MSNTTENSPRQAAQSAPTEGYGLEDLDAAPTSAPNRPPPLDDPAALRIRLREVQEENGGLHESVLKLQAQVRRLESEKRTAEVLDDLIEPYAQKSFMFMCVYSVSVGVLLLLDGFGSTFLLIGIMPFSLPETVLAFLVGSTAVTVIGLVGMVLTGVFVGARKQG